LCFSLYSPPAAFCMLTHNAHLFSLLFCTQPFFHSSLYFPSLTATDIRVRELRTMPFPSSVLRQVSVMKPYTRSAQPQRFRTVFDTPIESTPILLPPTPTVPIINRLPDHMLSKVARSSMRSVLLAGILATGALV
jgi:hypothetical protein